MRGGTESAPIDFRKAEGGVLGGDDDVGGARDADAAPEAVAVHGGNHRDGAIVDGREGVVAASIHIDDLGSVLGQLLDVDSGLKPLAFRPDHQAVDIVSFAEFFDGSSRTRTSPGSPMR